MSSEVRSISGALRAKLALDEKVLAGSDVLRLGMGVAESKSGHSYTASFGPGKCQRAGDLAVFAGKHACFVSPVHVFKVRFVEASTGGPVCP